MKVSIILVLICMIADVLCVVSLEDAKGSLRHKKNTPNSIRSYRDANRTSSHESWIMHIGSKWRLVTAKSSTRDIGGWEIESIAFFATKDCSESTRLNTVGGIPMDSGNAGEGWGPSGAFNESPMAWYGMPDENDLIWIGFEFPSDVAIQCMIVKQVIPSPKIHIQNRPNDQSNWYDIWIAEGLGKGIYQTSLP